MKQTLLFLVLLFNFTLIFSQEFINENFETMTVGNIGTNLTGATPGQNGWFTENTAGGTNGGNDNYQVILQNTNKVFQFTGSNAATGTKYMWKEGLDTSWADRTPGNNIVEVEVKMFAGAATTSKNTPRLLLYNADYSKVLGGLYYIPETRVIKGIAYFNSAGTLNNYIFTLGNTDVVLAENTWHTMGFSFNFTTGEVKWRGPGFNGFIMGASTGLNPKELDFVVAAGTGNTVASVTLFDDLVGRFSATDTLLSVQDNNLLNEVSIFPTISKDFVFLKSTSFSFSTINLFDINGRIVKTYSFNNENEVIINIDGISQGVYFVKATTDKGTFTQKIIKE